MTRDLIQYQFCTECQLKTVYADPRFGYTTLSYFVHTDDKTKIRQPNINYGIGIG
jgi:hypothetical protein